MPIAVPAPPRGPLRGHGRRGRGPAGPPAGLVREAPRRGAPDSRRDEPRCAQQATIREFRDVVFEEAGFENDSLLTLKTEGVGTSHLKLTWVRGLKLVF